MSLSADFFAVINSDRYASHIFVQLEPDQVLRGNGRRYPPLKPGPVVKGEDMTGKEKDEFNEKIIQHYKL